MKISKFAPSRLLFTFLVRAEKGVPPLAKVLLSKMPTLKSGFVFDNPYITGSGPEKLSDEYICHALEYVREVGGLAADSDLTTQTYTKVCKAYRAVDYWQRAQVVKYGAIASDSLAFQRVVTHLLTKGGIDKVMRVGGVLHGTGENNKGIEECYYIVKTMQRCKAGGKPPPQVADSETSSEQPEANPQETSADSTGGPSGDPATSQEELKIQEELKMNAQCAVFAGDAKEEGPTPLEAATTRATARLAEVTFLSKQDEFLALVTKKVSASSQRVVILIDAATCAAKINASFIDMAVPIIGATKGKVRLVMMLQRRFDLLSKAQKKLSDCLRSWQHFDVILKKSHSTSVQTSPFSHDFAIVSTPPIDKTGVSVSINMGKASVREKLHLRCTEKNCPMRPDAQRAALKKDCLDPLEEIAASDKEDLGECLERVGEDAAADDLPFDDEDMEQKRDYIVDLWPFARSIETYTNVFQEIGRGTAGSVCCILSCSAHPSPYIAARNMQMETFVYTNRMREHSLAHGTEVARKFWTGEELKKEAQGSLKRSYEAQESLVIRLFGYTNTPCLVEIPRHAKDTAAFLAFVPSVTGEIRIKSTCVCFWFCPTLLSSQFSHRNN